MVSATFHHGKHQRLILNLVALAMSTLGIPSVLLLASEADIFSWTDCANSQGTVSESGLRGDSDFQLQNLPRDRRPACKGKEENSYYLPTDSKNIGTGSEFDLRGDSSSDFPPIRRRGAVKASELEGYQEEDDFSELEGYQEEDDFSELGLRSDSVAGFQDQKLPLATDRRFAAMTRSKLKSNEVEDFSLTDSTMVPELGLRSDADEGFQDRKLPLLSDRRDAYRGEAQSRNGAEILVTEVKKGNRVAKLDKNVFGLVSSIQRSSTSSRPLPPTGYFKKFDVKT